MFSGTETQRKREGVSRGKVNRFIRSLSGCHSSLIRKEPFVIVGCSTREMLWAGWGGRGEVTVFSFSFFSQFLIREGTQQLECSFLSIFSDQFEIIILSRKGSYFFFQTLSIVKEIELQSLAVCKACGLANTLEQQLMKWAKALAGRLQLRMPFCKYSCQCEASQPGSVCVIQIEGLSADFQQE